MISVDTIISSDLNWRCLFESKEAVFLVKGQAVQDFEYLFRVTPGVAVDLYEFVILVRRADIGRYRRPGPGGPFEHGQIGFGPSRKRLLLIGENFHIGVKIYGKS